MPYGIKIAVLSKFMDCTGGSLSAVFQVSGNFFSKGGSSPNTIGICRMLCRRGSAPAASLGFLRGGASINLNQTKRGEKEHEVC